MQPLPEVHDHHLTGAQLFHLRCLGREAGAQQDHLKFCHLRGLQREPAKADPAAAPVQRGHGQGDRQHGQHDEVPRHHHLAQEAVVHIAHGKHAAQTNEHAQRLLLDVMEAVAHAQITGGV